MKYFTIQIELHNTDKNLDITLNCIRLNIAVFDLFIYCKLGLFILV